MRKKYLRKPTQFRIGLRRVIKFGEGEPTADCIEHGEVRYYGQIANDPAAVLKLGKKIAGNCAKLNFCYEAGPCGYALQRQITGLAHDCVVVAPSNTPVKKGVRVKNDRRDALTLARLHRAGEESFCLPVSIDGCRQLCHKRVGGTRIHIRGCSMKQLVPVLVVFCSFTPQAP